jgi:hypothetical protein
MIERQMNSMINNKCKFNKKILHPFRASEDACGGDVRYHGAFGDGRDISNFKLYFRLSRPNNRCTSIISNAIRIAGCDISRAGNPGWYIARFQR